MTDLFYQGEPFFMGILTLLLLTIIVIGTITSILMLRTKANYPKQTQQLLGYIQSIGLFAFVFGLFTQLLGLYGALEAIKAWGYVSPAILSAGLWTSSIPTVYGLLILLLSYLIRQGLTIWLERAATST